MTNPKKTAAVTLASVTAIPFAKLELSQSNVRRVAAGQSIEDLAEDIAHRGLLQSLSVRPVLDAAGQETGRYEVPAGGRRYRALELLVKAKRMPKTVAVPCLVRAADSAIGATEDSLAENALREALHPLDQFRAFKALADGGMSEAEIAARFFVTPLIVRQRLRLAAVHPALLDAYAAGETTLECVMAFTVTEDPERQLKVWEGFKRKGGTFQGVSAWSIRQALTERSVAASDARALFVGEAAYAAAGGTVLRDLFDQRGEGWFSDPALLDRLAEEKLAAFAEGIAAEGWRWVDVALTHSHGRSYGLRHLPTTSILSDDEAAAFEAAVEAYDGLNEQYGYGEEPPAEVADRIAALEAEIDDYEARNNVYEAADRAIGGVFVSLDYDGTPTVRRGYVRPEDEPAEAASPDEPAAATSGEDEPGTGDVAGGAAAGAASPARVAVDPDDRITRTIITIGGRAPGEPAPEPEENDRPLSEQHRIELTSYRTLALREAVADDPEAAFVAVLHALVIRVIVNAYRTGTCLEITATSGRVDQGVQGLAGFRPATGLDARREAWARRLPQEHGAIWDALLALPAEDRSDLFALCAGLSVNAMHSLYDRRVEAMPHADRLAGLVSLDMSRDWTPTAANYFGRVTKPRILAAVREAKGEETARLLEGLKKGDMAREAERLMAGTGWLPGLLRTPGLAAEPASATLEPEGATEAEAPGEDEPEGATAGDGASEEEDEPLPAFLADDPAAFGIAAE